MYTRRMSKKLKKILLLVAGICFIVLGLIGLVLPFLQGFLFLAIGIVLISLSVPAVRDLRKKHSVKFPKIHAKIEELEEWIERKLGDR